MTYAYNGRTFLPTGGFVMPSAKTKEKLTNATIKQVENEINADLFLLFVSRCLSKFLEDVIEKVFSNKELRYFDYAKKCIELYKRMDNDLSTHYSNLLECAGMDKCDKTGDILLAMWQQVSPIFKDYQYRNFKLFRNEYKIDDEDKAMALTTAVMISRIMHAAHRLTDAIYKSHESRYPNIAVILDKGLIHDADICSTEIASIIKKHLTKSDDDIIFTDQMKRYHETFIRTLIDKDLLLSSCRASNIAL